MKRNEMILPSQNVRDSLFYLFEEPCNISVVLREHRAYCTKLRISNNRLKFIYFI